MTALLKVAALASAYDTPIVPRGSGPYSYLFVVSYSNSLFQEYLANSLDENSVMPVFGGVFLNKVIPKKGYLDVSILEKPGFGPKLNAKSRLLPAERVLSPALQKSLSTKDERDRLEGEQVRWIDRASRNRQSCRTYLAT